MSTAINKAAVIGNTDFDEETWLVEPPALPPRSNVTQGSGRIIEWLQGATMNVDFQTRSALSRKLASQAAKKKPCVKLNFNGSSLTAVNEYTGLSADGKVRNGLNSVNSESINDEAQYVRQANTARVPPTIIQNATAHRSPRFEKSASLLTPAKSHSPSVQMDLNDIRNIVERQETELREELSKLKCSVYGENGKIPSSGARLVSQTQPTRPATALASSRSVEFGANSVKLSPLTMPSSATSHTSRLPTPIRKNVGRSMIPVPRTSLISRSAVRGFAGGSTPSLAVNIQHTSDETRSECGGILRNEESWADECF